MALQDKAVARLLKGLGLDPQVTMAGIVGIGTTLAQIDANTGAISLHLAAINARDETMLRNLDMLRAASVQNAAALAETNQRLLLLAASVERLAELAKKSGDHRVNGASVLPADEGNSP